MVEIERLIDWLIERLKVDAPRFVAQSLNRLIAK
jgi:hypothetical protein